MQWLDPLESVEDQAAFMDSCCGYSARAKEKLRRHSLFLDKPEAEITRICEDLTEKEKFRVKYFSKFIDTTCKEVISEVIFDQTEYVSFTDNQFRRRSNWRFQKLFSVDMKLLFFLGLGSPAHQVSDSARLPLLCAIQVGDYVFEWNKSSLVLPVHVNSFHSKPVLFSPLHQLSDWFADICKERRTVQDCILTSDYSMQIKLYYKWTERKDALLFAFISKVIEFNRGCVYHPQKCNSHTFVEECMRSLGVKNPPRLSTSIRQHISQLKTSKTLAKKRLSSHQELDAVVTEELLAADLPQNEVEYFMAHYLMFHANSYESSEQSPDKWTCGVPECRLQLLEGMLDASPYSFDVYI